MLQRQCDKFRDNDQVKNISERNGWGSRQSIRLKIILFFKIFKVEQNQEVWQQQSSETLRPEAPVRPELRKKNQVKSLIEKQKLRKFQGKSPIQFNPETRFGNCRQLPCVADFSKNWKFPSSNPLAPLHLGWSPAAISEPWAHWSVTLKLFHSLKYFSLSQQETAE